MVPKLQFYQIPRWVWASAAGLILTSSIAMFAMSAKADTSVKSNNLLGLIHDLNGTTNNMLANTQALHQQVGQVHQKLQQLDAQEAILQKQTETGKNLMKELKRQEDLTAQGVALMEQILDREKVSVDVTGQVSDHVQKLARDVAKNADTLQQVVGSLQASSQESKLLNSQMDQLQAELEKSKDSFKLFGRLKNLLQRPTQVIDSLLHNLL